MQGQTVSNQRMQTEVYGKLFGLEEEEEKKAPSCGVTQKSFIITTLSIPSESEISVSKFHSGVFQDLAADEPEPKEGCGTGSCSVARI